MVHPSAQASRHTDQARRPILITPGDPRGVGPEVTAKALRAWRDREDPWPVALIGDADALTPWCGDLPLRPTGDLADPTGIPLIAPIPGEPVEVAAVRLAVEACLSGRAAALVTGPIHKARLAARGFPYPGHTDFLGALCGVERPVMAFTGGELRVALVTVHLPLARVAAAITADAVLHTLRIAHRALVEQVGLARPRLLLAGLNPHAGDDGLLGREEIEVIAPASAAARREGIEVEGPISAEAAFLAARQGRGDMVIAMYHDQGLAPLKAVDFGRSVNWTLGLPIIRTSVDHGTADTLAGRGVADEGSMLAALSWAATLAGRAQGSPPGRP